MPRRNRGRRQPTVQDAWDVELPSISQGLRDYLSGDPVELRHADPPSDGFASSDGTWSSGGYLTTANGTYRISTTDRTTITVDSNSAPYTGDPLGFPNYPIMPSVVPQSGHFGGVFGALRVETPTIEPITDPNAKHIKHAFVTKKNEAHETTLMVSLPPLLDKPDVELIRYLDRAFAVILQALIAPTPIDRTKRSIIIEEDSDADAAETQPAEGQER